MSKRDLISVEFTAEEKEKMQTAFQMIKEVMDGKTVNLTPEERQFYGKINDKTENWITKVHYYMNEHPEMVPFYIDKEEFNKDVEARNTFMPWLKAMYSQGEGMEDTGMLLSHDIYNTALAFYRHMKLVSNQDVPGTTTIYEDLKSRFPGRPSSVQEEPEDPEMN
jgi:hypothetical protein